MPIHVTSETLYQSYTGPHASVYEQQQVTVTGTVQYTGPDPYGLPCIMLGSADSKVLCVVANDAGLAVGDEAQITGNCEGFTQQMVVLKHCQIMAS